MNHPTRFDHLAPPPYEGPIYTDYDNRRRPRMGERSWYDTRLGRLLFTVGALTGILAAGPGAEMWKWHWFAWRRPRDRWMFRWRWYCVLHNGAQVGRGPVRSVWAALTWSVP